MQGVVQGDEGNTADWARTFPAPAKLNLFLHVLGRRADGYHDIETLFRLIELADSLRFVPRADDVIRLATPVPGLDPDNDLCVRAARALREVAERSGAGPFDAGRNAGGKLPGVDIHLDKRIPMGGGLGGGSSDAATTLLALNQLWGLDLPRQRLAEIGLTLGADVPVFIFGRNAYAEGVGERFTEAILSPAWYVVLAPPVSVPTAAIFAAPELTRSTKSVKISGFSGSSASGQDASAWPQGTNSGSQGANESPRSPEAWPHWTPGFGANDMEAVAAARYPEVARHLAWLRAAVTKQAASGMTVRMSGSGGCVFAEFPGEGGEQPARAVLAGLPAGMKGWIARGLDKSPAP